MSEFWSQREWEDWSNELATILPEGADCWPGVNPEGAQESIIRNALRYLVAVEAAAQALAAEWERYPSEKRTEGSVARELRRSLSGALAETP